MSVRLRAHPAFWVDLLSGCVFLAAAVPSSKQQRQQTSWQDCLQDHDEDALSSVLGMG